MKTKATMTWTLAALIAAGTLLATAGTSFADRKADRGRGQASFTRDDHRVRNTSTADRRDWNRDRDRNDNRGRDWNRDGNQYRSWNRDRDGRGYNNYLRCPPITVIRTYPTCGYSYGSSVVVVRTISVPYVSLGFNFRL